MTENGHSDPQSRRMKYRRRVLRVLSWPAAILILVYFLFEDLFLSWLRPLFRYLGALAPFAALGRFLRRLPPYVALSVFAVPFILAEPVKIFSVFWIGIGHVVTGTILLVLAYIVSIFVVERLFHVMHEQLLSIGWFAWGYHKVMAAKAWALDLVRSTAIYRTLRPIGANIGEATRAGLAWLRERMRRIVRRIG